MSVSHTPLPTNVIRELLGALDMELQRQGKAAVIYVVRGTAMALIYHADRATAAVGGTFARCEVVFAAAKAVAAQAHIASLASIDESWLGDGVGQIMRPQIDDQPRSDKIGPALTVSIAPPDFVLALKALAAQQGRRDLEDAVALCRMLGITTTAQLETLIAMYFPGRPFGAHEMRFDSIIDAL